MAAQTTRMRALQTLTLKDGTVMPAGAVHDVDAAEAAALIKAGRAVPVHAAAAAAKPEPRP